MRNARVLEVGCGYGRSLLDVVGLTMNLVGVDQDKTAIEHAKMNLKKFPKVKLIVADGKKLPFKSGSFDYVLCLTTFANYDDKYKILREMRRVLKADGNVILSVYAENSLRERLKIYKKINAEIKEIKPNGTVVFDDFGINGYSEQFSKSQLKATFKKSELNIVEMKKVAIAYICMLSK